MYLLTYFSGMFINPHIYPKDYKKINHTQVEARIYRKCRSSLGCQKKFMFGFGFLPFVFFPQTTVEEKSIVRLKLNCPGLKYYEKKKV